MESPFKPLNEHGLGEESFLEEAGEGFNDQLLALSCDTMDVNEVNGSCDFGMNYMAEQFPHSPTVFADSPFTSRKWMPRIQGQSRLHDQLDGPNYSGRTTNDNKNCVAHLSFCDCNYCLSDRFLSQEDEQCPDRLKIPRQPNTTIEEVKETHERLVTVEGKCMPLDLTQKVLAGEADSGTQLEMSSKQWKSQPKATSHHGFNYEAISTGLGQHGSFSENIGQYQRYIVPAEMKTNFHMENSVLDESHRGEASSASSLTSLNPAASSHSSLGIRPSGSSSNLLNDNSVGVQMHRPSPETDTNLSSGRDKISTKAQHQSKTQHRFVDKSPPRTHKCSPKFSNASTLRWTSPAISLSDGVRRLEVNREMLPCPTEVQKKALAIVTGLSYNLVKDFYETKHTNPRDSAYYSNSSGEDSTGGIYGHIQDISSFEEQSKLPLNDQKNALQDNIISETLGAEILKRFQCTWCGKGCSKSFDKKGDWIRHEETVHCLQEFWTCNLPGSSGIAGCGKVFKVDYKCREHLRKDHKYDEKTAIQMAEGLRQPVSPPRPFRDECGFCGERFTGWKERMVHIAEHAEKGKRMSEWQDPFPRGKGAGSKGPDDDNDDDSNSGSGSGFGNSSNGKSNHGGNGGHWTQPKPRRDDDNEQRGKKRSYNDGDWSQQPHKSSLTEPVLESSGRLVDFFKTQWTSIWVVLKLIFRESSHPAKDTKKKCISDSLDELVYEDEQGWKQSRLSIVFLDSSKDITKSPPQLGYISILLIIINKMIGTGIFDIPSQIFYDTKSIDFYLIFWLPGVIVTMASILIYIEHGVTSPRCEIKAYDSRFGGERSYLSYVIKHPKLFTGYILGIVFILTGNFAANVLSFAVHLVKSAGYTDFYADSPPRNVSNYIDVLMIAAIPVICLMYGIQRRAGILVNNMLAIFKILILLMMIILGFISLGGKTSNTPLLSLKNLDLILPFQKVQNEPCGYALAYLGVVFSFGGVFQADSVLGEIGETKKAFRSPALYAIGTAFILYMFAIISFIVATMDQQVTGDVAEIFIKLTLGRVSTYGNTYTTEILNALLALSALGNVIVSIYIAAGVKQEIAKEHVLAFPGGCNYDARYTTFMTVANGVLSGADLIVVYIFSMPSILSIHLSRIVGSYCQGGAAERDLQAGDGNGGGSNGEKLRYTSGCIKPGKPNSLTIDIHQ